MILHEAKSPRKRNKEKGHENRTHSERLNATESAQQCSTLSEDDL